MEKVSNTEDNNKDNLNIEILPPGKSVPDRIMKLIIVGDSGVGKSCLSIRATQDIFDTQYQPTLGVEFFSLDVQVNDEVMRLQIWDTCGQEVYRSLISNYYRNASLAIVVYAINDIKSFNGVEDWLKELKKYTSPDVKIFMIGNKADLKEEREVLYEKALEFKNDYDLNYLIETSAKEGFNTRELFKEAARVLYLEYKGYDNLNDSIKVDDNPRMSNASNSKCACHK